MGNIACCQSTSHSLETSEEKTPIRGTTQIKAEVDDGIKQLREALKGKEIPTQTDSKVKDRAGMTYEQIKAEVDRGIKALRGIQTDAELDELQKQAEDDIVEIRCRRKAEAEQLIRDRMNGKVGS